MPRFAVIDRFEDAAAGAIPRGVFPRTLPRLPKSCVSNIRIFRIEEHIRAADVLVFIENFLKRLASIGRTKNPALFIWTIRMTGDRHQQAVRIAWIDRDLRNLLAVAQAEMCPRVTCVGRLVDTIAYGKIRTL